jgi:superfamily I DNA/RNA helicase
LTRSGGSEIVSPKKKKKKEAGVRLLDVSRRGGCLVIKTDEGERKQSLRWRVVEELEAKCHSLKGKLVATRTWNPVEYSPREWFAEIWEVDENGDRVFQENERWSSNKSHPAISALGDVSTEDVQDKQEARLKSDIQSSQRIYGPPGTGKTTYLIKEEVGRALERGIQPEKIAFLTFTNVAANAAAEKLASIYKLSASAFSHFRTLYSMATLLGGDMGKGVMKEEHRIDFDSSFSSRTEWMREGDVASIVDRPSHPIIDDWSLCLARCEETFQLSDDKQAKVVLEKRYKRKIDDADIYTFAKKFLREYMDYKEKNNLIDFDDVLLNVTNEDLVEGERLPDLDLLVIDEAQDLSSLQWNFVERLAKKSKRLVIAGDDDQAILSSFGSAPERFVSYPTTEADRVLDVSYRVPPALKTHVDDGVLQAVKSFFENRVSKIWRSSKNLTGGDLFKVSLTAVCEEIMQRQDEDWLLMAPTNSTVDRISRALRELKIPHYKKNKPVPSGIAESTSVRVKTVHTAKGEEADNVVFVELLKADFFMTSTDPRLAYVAHTRAKKELYLVKVR